MIVYVVCNVILHILSILLTYFCKNYKTKLTTNKQGHLYFLPIFNERWLNTNIVEAFAQHSIIPGVFSFTDLHFFIIQSINSEQILIFMSLIVQDSRKGIYFPIASSRAFPTSRKTTEVFFRALSEVVIVYFRISCMYIHLYFLV